jgi:tryptophan halogenase
MKALVVGGGTAGLIMATILKRMLDIKVDVVRSEEIGIVGVGEGSTEHFADFLKTVGLDHYSFMKHTDATFKSGIMFEGWNPKRRYLHSIGEKYAEVAGQYHYTFARQIINNEPLVAAPVWESMVNRWFLNRREEYAYNQMHFNTYKMNEYLTFVAEQLGVQFFNDKIEEVVLKENGYIQKVVGEKREYRYDFYVDATGFKRLLMGKLGAEWESFSKYMKMNSAITFQTEVPENENLNLWTIAKAMNSGWFFRLPTWDHYGNGYIFDKNYIDADGAKEEVERMMGQGVEVGKSFSFDPGYLKKQWINNCVSVGLASAFVEPLEATSIGTSIQQAFILAHRLINYDDNSIARYNNSVEDIMLNIRDFISLHYVTPRRDTDFWFDVSEMELPERMQERLNEWKYRLPVSEDFAGESEYIMFTAGNFIQVMEGLDLLDRQAIRKEFMGKAKIIRDRAESQMREEDHFNATLDLIPHREFMFLLREVFA